MAISYMQQPDESGLSDICRNRFALDQDRQLTYARQHGYHVLTITAPDDGYIVTKDKMVMARCKLLMEAAEVAAALAYYRENGRP
jgi:hypothetical protein